MKIDLFVEYILKEKKYLYSYFFFEIYIWFLYFQIDELNT